MTIRLGLEVEDDLREELLGAAEEAERKQRPLGYVAAQRVWDVIVARPTAMRDTTMRRFGADDRTLAMVEAMLHDDEWNVSDAWLAAVDPIVDRIADGLADLDGEIDEQIDTVARLLGWRFG